MRVLYLIFALVSMILAFVMWGNWGEVNFLITSSLLFCILSRLEEKDG